MTVAVSATCTGHPVHFAAPVPLALKSVRGLVNDMPFDRLEMIVASPDKILERLGILRQEQNKQKPLRRVEIPPPKLEREKGNYTPIPEVGSTIDYRYPSNYM